MENSINFKVNRAKLILGRIFFFYAVALFMVSALFVSAICACYNLFISNKYQRAVFFHSVSKCWIKSLLVCLLIRLKVFVLSKTNISNQNIYIINHRSFVDILLSTPFLPQANMTIGKHSFAKIPIFNIIYKMGAILVDRKNAQSRLQSFYDLQECLNNKLSVCIYPEGTRNKSNDTLLPFQKGAFKLAHTTQTNIAPVVFKNTHKILPAHISFYLMPHSLEIYLLPTINPSGFESDQQLQEHCYLEMQKFIQKKFKP